MTNQKEPRVCINLSVSRYTRRDQFILPINIAKTAVKDNNDDMLPFSCLVVVVLVVVTYRIKLGGWNGGEFSTKLSELPELSDRTYLHITVLVTPCESELMTHDTSVRCCTIHRIIIGGS